MRPKIISFFDTVSNPKLGAKFERPSRNSARALASIFRYYEANQAVSELLYLSIADERCRKSNLCRTNP